MVFPCFSRMRSKGQGFPFHSGGLGVEGVFAERCVYDRNRSRPFTTVRNRLRRSRMAVPMASSRKAVTFGGFQCRVASFRVAGVALRDSPTRFITCWQSFCVAGAILLPSISRTLFGAGVALWRLPSSFRMASAAL